jgi:carnitine O-acetyltransferase
MLSVSKLTSKLLRPVVQQQKVQRRALHQTPIVRASSMNQHQSKLPKIPVPALKDTLQRYLVAVEPLITPEQMQKTKLAVAEFESNPAWGPYLQEQLQELDRLTNSSYIEGFWDTMYLEIRDPIVTNVNPGFILAPNPHTDQDPTKLASLLGTTVQIARTAQLLEASAQFVNLVKTEALPTDMEKTTPLDMSQYPKLFSSTRIPGYSRDTFQTLADKNARHVLVISRGQYFLINILDDAGIPLPATSIASQLVTVDQQALSTGQNFYPLGPLTGQDRLRWSFNYSHLSSLENNAAALNTLESSLFVVCLEDSAPNTINEAGQIVLHGPSSFNRYYDKSIQLIVFQDGRTGINFEHTGFDGHTVLTYVSNIHAYKADLSKLKPVQSSFSVTKLTFSLDDKLKNEITAAQLDFQARSSTLSSAYLDWNGHGKKFITASGFSPDAYVQMAFQLTQKRLFGKLVSTYESSNVKHYNRGRTECVRSATSDAKKFVETFDSVNANNEEKLSSLNAAVTRHVAEMKKSKEGKLIDRHLQVLNWLSMQQLQRQAGYKRPTLFTDAAYGTHFASILSTSNCGSPALDHFSFGPVTGSGFGLGYMIKDNSIPVAVTSFQGKAQMFADGLKQSLTDLQTFVSKHAPKKL